MPQRSFSQHSRQIELRGVTVHNLQNVDLDIEHQRLVVFCGVSGSGKTSLALDTLYAEGQRRYIESFSAYTRQFLEKLEKPAAERIDGIPPAVAVTHKHAARSSRATVGTVTEIIDYLRLLFARVGKVQCHDCRRRVRRDSAQTASESLAVLPAGTRFMVTFPVTCTEEFTAADLSTALREDGFIRVLHAGQTMSIDQFANAKHVNGESQVVVDRLAAGRAEPTRVRESLETAFSKGQGRCHVYLAADARAREVGSRLELTEVPSEEIDGTPWCRVGFNDRLICENCDREYPRQEPRLYSFNSPLGACSDCEGFGDVMDIDLDLIVPNSNKSLSEGAIAPWNTPAYAHELEELLALAPDYGIPIHEPFRNLRPEHLRYIREGVPERDFGGLNGFFAWLERRKYKMHIRVFLSRWRSYRTCPTCQGARLRADALATKIAGHSIAELSDMRIEEVLDLLNGLELSDHDQQVGKTLLEQVTTRLGYLCSVGVGYLSLGRPLRTISSGESQRVTLTSALGSNLVNMLYVLDEPSVGLHPEDIDCLLGAIRGLRDRGNTVVVVEHEPTIIDTADEVIEIGPGAGHSGGHVVFQGTPLELRDDAESITGDYLAGRRGLTTPERRRQPTHGKIQLTGARGNNLRNLEVEFPLGLMCLVTGVSGAGKSSLVEQTLYPALCRRKRKDKEIVKPLPYDEVFGDGQLDDVLLIDQSPIGRSSRSNPVTYIKAFDAIRNVFADTLEARTHNYKASHFSFNVDGGRCDTCKGDGFLEIDMQFLADVTMRCPECQSRRYRREILEVHYRGKSIYEVLEMTAREAFSFFRGQNKVQNRLRQLIDVGLDYLRLGQPANTLSVGEAQRLKLAGYLSAPRRGRTLFLLDEPTTGLHFADILKLLDCFDALLNVGHSLIIVEHNEQMMKAADYVIDIGPGAADAGGCIVAEGTPEEIARCGNSATGRILARALAEEGSRA